MGMGWASEMKRNLAQWWRYVRVVSAKEEMKRNGRAEKRVNGLWKGDFEAWTWSRKRKRKASHMLRCFDRNSHSPRNTSYELGRIVHTHATQHQGFCITLHVSGTDDYDTRPGHRDPAGYRHTIQPLAHAQLLLCEPLVMTFSDINNRACAKFQR